MAAWPGFHESPRNVLEGLVRRLTREAGLLESVVDEWRGDTARGVARPGHSAARHRAGAVLAELHETWGAPGDPTWVDGLIPGRPTDDHEREEDFLFALFRRPGVCTYPRLRGERSSSPMHVRLILGAVRGPMGSGIE